MTEKEWFKDVLNPTAEELASLNKHIKALFTPVNLLRWQVEELNEHIAAKTNDLDTYEEDLAMVECDILELEEEDWQTRDQAELDDLNAAAKELKDAMVEEKDAIIEMEEKLELLRNKLEVAEMVEEICA